MDVIDSLYRISLTLERSPVCECSSTRPDRWPLSVDAIASIEHVARWQRPSQAQCLCGVDVLGEFTNNRVCITVSYRSIIQQATTTEYLDSERQRHLVMTLLVQDTIGTTAFVSVCANVLARRLSWNIMILTSSLSARLAEWLSTSSSLLTTSPDTCKRSGLYLNF